MLVVVCGFPGSGKTTVSEDIVSRLDATRLRTDVIRKELFPDPDYTDEEQYTVYEEMVSRARDLHAEDDVVLDATFNRAAYRDLVRDLAADVDADLTVVRVECDEETVRERIAAREGDESDADFRIHQLYRDEHEPLRDDHVVVDNSGSLAETERQVAELFRGDDGEPVIRSD